MAKLRIASYMLAELLKLPSSTKIAPEVIELDVIDPVIDSSVIDVEAIYGTDYDGDPYFDKFEPVTYMVAGHEVPAKEVDKFLKSLKLKK